MNSRRLIALLAGFCLLASCSSSQDAEASDRFFRDLGGKLHDPLDVGDAKANVLIFILTDCPIANQYAPEIRAIQQDHQDDPLKFYLVHVDPEVTVEAVRKHAKDYSHACTVIRDRHHRLVQRIGVTMSPEAAVVAAGGQVVYRGRIDNLYGDLGRKRPLGATRHELRDAITALMAGQEVQVKRTEAVGCDIPDLPQADTK